MAIIKHIAIKNSNYNAASDYLTTMYDEFECVAILEEDGSRIPRDDYIIEGILCDPLTFGIECEEANHYYGKNQLRNEIKAHHYIISFDPKDKTENGLTMERAQELGMAFAKKNFPGHQTLVCTHADGHNGNGNIHIHIVLNSLRIENVERQPFMERPSDCLAGMKHHVSKNFLNYLKLEVMDLCQRENLYQIDLLNPAKVKITDREYWAQRRGQAKLDKENSAKIEEGVKPEKTKYETQKEILRNAITASMENSHSIEELKDRLLSDYGIFLFESRGRFSFQMPGRTKAIRARQLGTDFEKESIQKHFEEVKGRAGMPVLHSDGIETGSNTPEISAAQHSTAYENITLPEGAGSQISDEMPATSEEIVVDRQDNSDHQTASKPQNAADHKDAADRVEAKLPESKTTPTGSRAKSVAEQKTDAPENAKAQKIRETESPQNTGAQKASIPKNTPVQESTAPGRSATPRKSPAPMQQGGTGKTENTATIPVRQEQKPAPLPKRTDRPESRKPSAPAPSVRLITDLENCIKAQENSFYAQKVKISNLKEMAKTMNFLKENGIGTIEELSALVSASSKDTESKRTALKATEDRLKTINLLIKNSGQYFANKKVYGEYLKAKNKKAFRDEHTAEIMLYEAARKALKELSDGKPIPNLKQLRAEKEKLVALKNEQYESYSHARSRHIELQNVQSNVHTILGDEKYKNTVRKNREEI